MSPWLLCLTQVFVAFYQVITKFGTTYSVQLPQYYWDWMAYFDFLTFELQDVLGVPSDCLASGFSQMLLLTALLPLGFIAVVFGLLMLRTARVLG